MTESDKKLVSIDLCGRLPYGVKVHNTLNGEVIDLKTRMYCLPTALATNFKPYLRPLKESNMTEAEAIYYYNTVYTCLPFTEKVDWLNEHMFDYRNLIEQGLALQAPEGMYEIV